MTTTPPPTAERVWVVVADGAAESVHRTEETARAWRDEHEEDLYGHVSIRPATLRP